MNWTEPTSLTAIQIGVMVFGSFMLGVFVMWLLKP